MAMPMPEPDVETGGDTESADTITVPRSVLGDRQCKPGEKLTFVVVDADEDGAEVKLADSAYSKGGEGGNAEMDNYPMET
jgi:hypothetical protein